MDKVLLVTGGSRGIGAATALAVITVGRRLRITVIPAAGAPAAARRRFRGVRERLGKNALLAAAHGHPRREAEDEQMLERSRRHWIRAGRTEDSGIV